MKHMLSVIYEWSLVAGIVGAPIVWIIGSVKGYW